MAAGKEFARELPASCRPADLVCPRCYLGQRHLELAPAELPHVEEVEIKFRFFQT